MAENPSSQPLEDQPDSKRQKLSTTTTSDGEEQNLENSLTVPRKPKYKRRKIAIFFAYCGVGYQGMQKNPGAKTIEGDLEEALYHSGAVPEEERGQTRRFDWGRSARTDKGVSAVGQVVSGKFYVDPPGFVERLNSNLSPQIRIFGYKRVTPSFSAKKFCDRRRNTNINVPMAPEVGLYLDECFFSSYNKRWKDSHEELSMKAYAQEAEDFKIKYIYPHIASSEHKDGSVAVWLHSLNYRNYPDLRVTEGTWSSDKVVDDCLNSNVKHNEIVNMDEIDFR